MKWSKKAWAVPVLLVCFLITVLAEHQLATALPEQTVANRWSKEDDFSQISCFFSETANVTESQLPSFRTSVEEALEAAAIETDGKAGRTFVDAYSTQGTLTLTSDRTSVSVRAFGVGGDYFLFHPITLLSGNYFDGTDDNEDGVILDEDVAWQLFGSYQVAGMKVEIGNAVYVVRGVVRRELGMFSEAAGIEKPTVYVSYPILDETAENALPIENYEVLIASPVKAFGSTTITNALGLSEDAYVQVENSKRFSLSSRFALLKSFGARSMSLNGIVYPYWENQARAYEDVSALLLVVQIALLIYPIIFFAQKGRKLWKGRKRWKKQKQR